MAYSKESMAFCGIVLTVHAQPDIQTTKHRDMAMDSCNSLKTNARLTFSATGTHRSPDSQFITPIIIMNFLLTKYG